MDKYKIKEYQRKHRDNPTFAEKSFENILNKLEIPFESQKIVRVDKGNSKEHDYKWFIVDFYIRHPYKVVVEIDGGSHNSKIAYDDTREDLITQKKPFWSIWRFSNDEVVRNPDELKEKLRVAFSDRSKWTPTDDNIREIIKSRKMRRRAREQY